MLNGPVGLIDSLSVLLVIVWPHINATGYHRLRDCTSNSRYRTTAIRVQSLLAGIFDARTGPTRPKSVYN
jgi:hypothetical protein